MGGFVVLLAVLSHAKHEHEHEHEHEQGQGQGQGYEHACKLGAAIVRQRTLCPACEGG